MKRQYDAPVIEDRRPIIGLLTGGGNLDSECLRTLPPGVPTFFCDPDFPGSG